MSLLWRSLDREILVEEFLIVLRDPESFDPVVYCYEHLLVVKRDRYIILHEHLKALLPDLASCLSVLSRASFLIEIKELLIVITYTVKSI